MTPGCNDMVIYFCPKLFALTFLKIIYFLLEEVITTISVLFIVFYKFWFYFFTSLSNLRIKKFYDIVELRIEEPSWLRFGALSSEAESP